MYCIEPYISRNQTVSSYMNAIFVLQSPNDTEELASVKSPGGGKARRKSDSKICEVCGDHALGVNFDAVCCESCKAFFRRNALKEKVRTHVDRFAQKGPSVSFKQPLNSSFHLLSFRLIV